MEQQQAQNVINAQMAKFQHAANYPNQQLSILQSALGMTPYEQGSRAPRPRRRRRRPSRWAWRSAACRP